MEQPDGMAVPTWAAGGAYEGKERGRRGGGGVLGDGWRPMAVGGARGLVACHSSSSSGLWLAASMLCTSGVEACENREAPGLGVSGLVMPKLLDGCMAGVAGWPPGVSGTLCAERMAAAAAAVAPSVMPSGASTGCVLMVMLGPLEGDTGRLYT